jgi:RNA polymerase sigma-70 factor, ECF subfamily
LTTEELNLRVLASRNLVASREKMPATPNAGVSRQESRSAKIALPVAELYEKSGAQVVGLDLEEFSVILREIVAKYLPAGASAKDAHEFCGTLRLEELALARACAAGHVKAWEVFLMRFRERLFEIANYITKETSAGRELADSIYAELYGTTIRDGRRVSKLASYTGRGSLEGWLRTVMAQEHVNRYRRQRRMVSLDEESEGGVQFAAAEPADVLVVDSRVEVATDEALGALAAEDRFILASYFLDDRTLAEVARALGVHESTISRKLDKLAKLLRKQILAALIRDGMSRRQAQEAMEIDIRDLRVNIRQHLAQESAHLAFSKKKEKDVGLE